MATFCSNCGSSLEVGARFCGECGRSISVLPAKVLPAEPAQAQVAPPQTTIIGDVTHGAKITNYGSGSFGGAVRGFEETSREGRSNEPDGSRGQKIEGSTFVGDYVGGNYIKNVGGTINNTHTHIHSNDRDRAVACGVCQQNCAVMESASKCSACGQSVCRSCREKRDPAFRTSTVCLSCGKLEYTRCLSEVYEDLQMESHERQKLLMIARRWLIPEVLYKTWDKEAQVQAATRIAKSCPADRDWGGMDELHQARDLMREGRLTEALAVIEPLYRRSEVPEPDVAREYFRCLIAESPADAQRKLEQAARALEGVADDVFREAEMARHDCQIRLHGMAGVRTMKEALERFRLRPHPAIRLKECEVRLDELLLGGGAGEGLIKQVEGRLDSVRNAVVPGAGAEEILTELDYLDGYLVFCRNGGISELGNQAAAIRLRHKVDWLRAGELRFVMEFPGAGKQGASEHQWRDGDRFGRGHAPLFQLLQRYSDTPPGELMRVANLSREERRSHTPACGCVKCLVERGFSRISTNHFLLRRRDGCWQIRPLSTAGRPCNGLPSVDGCEVPLETDFPLAAGEHTLRLHDLSVRLQVTSFPGLKNRT